MKCSVCSNQISEKYCSNCGQYFKDSRVTSITILWGLFESFFSLEKSIFMNIKIALTNPKTIVSNYWNGFRKYYFTPFQFFTIASLSLLINYYLFNNFLGLSLTVNNISSHFAVLALTFQYFSLSKVQEKYF